MIPKIIWQTGKWTKDKIPYPYNKNIKAWKNIFLDWDYRYYDRFQRTQMIKSMDSKNLYLFLDLPPVQQQEYWACYALYNYGGLYVDINSIPTGASLQLLNDKLDKYKLIIEDSNVEIHNNYFLCEPKNKILKYILDNYFDFVIQKGIEGSDIINIWSKLIKEHDNQEEIFYTNLGIMSNLTDTFPDHLEIQYNGNIVKYSDIDFMNRE